MSNANEIPGIERGTSPSTSVDKAAETSWAANHRGSTDPNQCIQDQYNKAPLDVPLKK
jgi:hypothetical protein